MTLFEDNMKKDQKNTFTKKAVTILLIVGIISAEIPFCLSFLDKETAEAIAIAWITEIVAVITVYMCKSYFETKQERKQDLEDYLAEKGEEDGLDD